MLVEPISPAKAVPAEALFPTWRGREPYRDRLEAVSAALTQAHPHLTEAIAALPFERFEAADGGNAIVHKYNEVPAAATAPISGRVNTRETSDRFTGEGGSVAFGV